MSHQRPATYITCERLPTPIPAQTPYFERLAAAYVRGKLSDAAVAHEHPALFAAPLAALTDADLADAITLGLASGLRLHRFKRTMGLARVTRVLGALHGIHPSSLLDIGSGRGAFLWPLLDTFPDLPVTCIDTLARRVADIQAVRDGGLATLRAVQADATALPFAERTFDVVTMLEVLEHISDTQQALSEVCRVAGRFLLLSVPSRPDTNPEHIHLFDQPTLTALLRANGMIGVHTDYVLNHLLVIARRPAP